MVSMDQILEMEEKQLLMLMENCRKILAKDQISTKQETMAKSTMDLIEESGRLSVDSDNPVGISAYDPIFTEMRDIVDTPKNLKKMIETAEENIPPLSVVDPQLFKAMGERYSQRYHATQTAGDFVAQAMKSNGFIKSGTAKLPEGCIAKTGSKFKRK